MSEIQVTLKKSLIGAPQKVRVVAEGLGLKKIGKVKTYKDTNCIRGAVNKIKHLVDFEVVE